VRPALEVVLFDLGHVLVDVDLERSRERWRAATGSSGPSFDAVFFESGLKAHMDCHPFTASELVARVRRTLDAPHEVEEILAVWNACLTPDGAALALAARVARRARVGVVSDTDPFHAAHLRALPELAAIVEHWTFSFEVGACKPAPAPYEAALARFEAPPGRALFIDDKPANVEGARTLGLDGIVFTGVGALERALRERDLV
jgi:glucose-1-phosphatase